MSIIMVLESKLDAKKVSAVFDFLKSHTAKFRSILRYLNLIYSLY